MAGVAPRVLLVALALVCGGVGVSGLRSSHRCGQAQRAARTAAIAALSGVAGDIADHCDDPRDEVVGAVTLGSRGEHELAVSLARRVATRNPEDYLGWLAIYRLGGDQRALARAHRLNPRAVPAPSR
jgi:hypothetical protein